LYAALPLLLMDTVTGSQSGTIDCIFYRDSFFGDEYLVLVVESVYSGPNLDEGGRRGHEPIGTEGQMAVVGKQGLEGEGT